jgi:hypothetical protein
MRPGPWAIIEKMQARRANFISANVDSMFESRRAAVLHGKDAPGKSPDPTPKPATIYESGSNRNPQE